MALGEATLNSPHWPTIMSARIKAVRLATLLRGFGLCPVEISKQESKSAVSRLKAAYREKAKVQHPDLASPGNEDEAQQNFAKLSTEYDEALTLLEAGVSPVMINSSSFDPTSHASEAHPAFRHHSHWAGTRASRQAYEPQQFDTYTRVKGHLIVWSSLFVFMTCLREFLVGCAGSTWAWQPPSNLNPFWVRRYSDDWNSQDAPLKKPEGEKKPVKDQPALPKERKVSEFYQKRRISNVRRDVPQRS